MWNEEKCFTSMTVFCQRLLRYVKIPLTYYRRRDNGECSSVPCNGCDDLVNEKECWECLEETNVRFKKKCEYQFKDGF